MLEKADFFRAITDIKTLPKSISEVIFAGRSNVGKSSVINGVCGRKNLARSSKTPGRTRSVNVFSISHGRWLIDLPGYGFARVSPEEKSSWKKMIEDCIQRPGKKTVFVIIDALVGPTELDCNMVEWLQDLNVGYKIIANKCDKLPAAVSGEAQVKTAEFFNIDKSCVYAVSAKKKYGFDKLKSDIETLLK